MAESNTGSWVRRVGSAGGGKTYRRRRPVNFYGVIAVVIVLGLCSVGYARYLYRNPSANGNAIPPTVGTTWYAALGIDTCGTVLAPLTANPNATSGFTAIPNGAIRIAPTTAAEAGNNAVLEKFTSSYPGLSISSTKLTVPNQGTASTSKNAKKTTTYHLGETCPSGTKYAGKKGYPLIAYWSSIGTKSPSVATNAANVKFSPNMLITLWFGPKGTTPPQPPQSAITAMLDGPSTVSTTTTTAPVVTTTSTTTGPTATTTTKP